MKVDVQKLQMTLFYETMSSLRVESEGCVGAPSWNFQFPFSISTWFLRRSCTRTEIVRERCAQNERRNSGPGESGAPRPPINTIFLSKKSPLDLFRFHQTRLPPWPRHPPRRHPPRLPRKSPPPATRRSAARSASNRTQPTSTVCSSRSTPTPASARRA